MTYPKSFISIILITNGHICKYLNVHKLIKHTVRKKVSFFV